MRAVPDQADLRDVTKIQASARAFAALRSDGHVVAWGDASCGGDTGPVARQLYESWRLKWFVWAYPGRMFFFWVFFEVLDVDLFGGKRCFLSVGGELFCCIFLGFWWYQNQWWHWWPENWRWFLFWSFAYNSPSGNGRCCRVCHTWWHRSLGRRGNRLGAPGLRSAARGWRGHCLGRSQFRRRRRALRGHGDPGDFQGLCSDQTRWICGHLGSLRLEFCLSSDVCWFFKKSYSQQ